MTTENEPQTWGEEPPPTAPGTGWTGRKVLVAVAIAVGITAAGGGVIYAAANSDAAQQGMGGPRGYGMKGGMMIMGGPFGDTLHGQFQHGEVTAVDAASITVKSTDGFSRTYVIDDGTHVNGGQGDLDDIATGDVVVVVASETDGAATADSIFEGDRQRVGKPGVRPGAPDEQDTPPTR